MELIATDYPQKGQPKKLIQKGNSKLKQAKMLMFNLPAGKVSCNMECAGCYAMREQTRFPSSMISRMYRYEQAQKPDFASKLHEELNSRRSRPKFFRVHASGEFFSQKYVNDWVDIARKNPDITFYAYTKRMKHFDFKELSSLDNFVLINSLQYKRLNYGSLEEAPKGAFICPSYKGAVCGVSCTYCMDKAAQVSAPYFKKH